MGTDPMHYLYGVTGSGKTEVFLQAASRVLGNGQSVIYLVPEIALTTQVVDAVRGRFGPLAAVIHSGLSPSQKLTEWRRILRGEARVVVGARSAIFAPVVDLGLVVIDEEHEASYKSGSSPRYHARQVAMRRCIDSGARLVMGSATPSVEAWHQMSTGKLARHSLSTRVAGGAMPDIRVVRLDGVSGALSGELVNEIRETKSLGRQTIIFLNRRGFSHFFRCRSCGYELQCRHCSVGLTYHKDRGRMVCHYCGFQTEAPRQCPECGSVDVGWAGFGTEQVEEEIARLFPDLSVARLDTDVAAKKGEAKRVLDAFRQGKTDILLGTQMVAKGLNFPGLRLVGVVLADTALHMPDFRAAERAFALVTQVAGRAGRYRPDGRVIVQTYMPRTPAIALAAKGEIEAFYAQELAVREMAGFPPFTRIIRVVVRSKELSRAKEGAAAFARVAGECASPDVEILGPAECPIGRVAQNFRWQVMGRSASWPTLHGAFSRALSAVKLPAACYAEVDVDPVSLL